MPRIATDNLTVNNLGMFNEISAPNRYTNSDLKEFQQLGDLAQYGFFDEVPVSAVVSRVVQPANAKAPLGLVIVVLDVLPAYSHKHGLEDLLLDYIEGLAPQKRLEQVFLLADLKKDSWLIEHAKSRGYEEDSGTSLRVVGKQLENTEGKLLLRKSI